jgi:cobalt-zinc-cadmium efflux system membrane fusion protein
VYQAQPVTLGRRDASHVEVTAGLKPGARVVIAESFLVKADIEKSGASHDH